MGMVLYLRRASAPDIDRMRATPDQLGDFVYGDGEPNSDLVDFDKAWHALHYLLTGSADATKSPLSLLLGDWETFGQDENGFGGGWIAPPKALQAFNAALSRITDVDLRARYDPAAMHAEDVYLSDVFVDEGPEALDYLLQSLPELRRFAARCADTNAGAIIVLG
jgi:hypothetical protein